MIKSMNKWLKVQPSKDILIQIGASDYFWFNNILKHATIIYVSFILSTEVGILLNIYFLF